ncbi:hypothetical protein JM946_18745 [Steroidobacter sp. S1-65]|uniref:Peptidase metallopeptidase domain-containing protein n=1 Tax=Steroidobacter gossypii TaxID=2805490 RepID=A0ABS1X0P4_9GAMM|nr:hypothetical protein [Steroidobacter gossypii]MBM0106776.1 hypothetical protein [Steroidobacter gossypii]
MTSQWAAKLASHDLVLDALPADVERSIRQRNTWLRNLRASSQGFEFVLVDVSRWNPGQHVRVAFDGGDAALRRDVMDATREITDSCNLTLDFGPNTAAGQFRTWSSTDAEYAGEIRVSFEHDGYFSLVGTDSVNPEISGGPIGGGPGQCSLNLGGFTINRPNNWRGVVRHEFLHALSFHHAHQNLRGPCEQEFRWEDDEGYQRTEDARGAFVNDSEGRRPGIYTYLSGFPNFWDKTKVDFNLRTEDHPDVVVGPFDPHSVMLYRFPPLFYKNVPSACAPQGDGESLSEGDKRGLQLLYPGVVSQIETLQSRRETVLAAVDRAQSTESQGFESSASVARLARATASTMRNVLQMR